MDMDLRQLTAAAGRLGVQIRPTRDEDGNAALEPRDRAALIRAIDEHDRNYPRASLDCRNARAHLGDRAPHTEGATVKPRDLNDLISALDQIFHAATRADKIRRGQYVGPMSASEAVQFVMRTRRR